MSRKLLALLMALLMVISCLAAVAEKPLPTNATVMIRTDELDFTGKTVIIHSNDVHGAIDGYAYMTQYANYVKDV